jgi:CRISPR-associated protein Csm5
MKQTTISILTPTHIGSGQMIQGNSEYLYFSAEKMLVIIDDQKILEIIGVDQIPIWMDYIEKSSASFLDYLKKRKQNIAPQEVALRQIELKGHIYPNTSHPLRTQIRTGMGMAYIPGSSIKGAIRTAVFASKILQEHLEEGVDDILLKNRRFKFADGNLSKKVFGENPNHDWFRLLQVSDFHFSGATEAAFSETLNERRKEEYTIKKDVKQLIEYLPAKPNALKGSIKFNENLQHRASFRDVFNQQGSEVTLDILIDTINQHTKRLIEREVKFFEGMILPDECRLLFPELKRILAMFSALSPNECILRMGFGTGFRNMTGNWVEDIFTNDQWHYLNDQVRGKRYEDYPLPKSRKIILGGIPMGFIKMTINQNQK